MRAFQTRPFRNLRHVAVFLIDELFKVRLFRTYLAPHVKER